MLKHAKIYMYIEWIVASDCLELAIRELAVQLTAASNRPIGRMQT